MGDDQISLLIHICMGAYGPPPMNRSLWTASCKVYVGAYRPPPAQELMDRLQVLNVNEQTRSREEMAENLAHHPQFLTGTSLGRKAYNMYMY